MSNIIEDIYHDLKENNYNECIKVPYDIECSGTVGNFDHNKSKEKYEIGDIPASYYMTFKKDEN